MIDVQIKQFDGQVVAICKIQGKGWEYEAGLAAMKRIAYLDRKWSDKAGAWMIHNADRYACTVQEIGTAIRIFYQKRHQI
jgi:hypothetical protein